MAVFQDTTDLYNAMEELWTWIKNDPEVSEKLLSSRLVVRFTYKNPEGSMTVDGSDGNELKIIFGDTDKEPVIEMLMNSDLAHEFWLGKVNVAVALMTGKIVSRGPVNRALALLPAVRPAYQIYPNIAARLGKTA
jgi:hypothetical protein